MTATELVAWLRDRAALATRRPIDRAALLAAAEMIEQLDRI